MSPTWAGPTRTTRISPTNRSSSSSCTSTYMNSVRYISMAVPLPLLLPSILVAISFRLQQETCWKFSGHLIQGIYFPPSCLKQPDRPGEPNAIHWHATPDLPPQSIFVRPDRVTSFLSASFLVLVHKYFHERPPVARALHVHLSSNGEFTGLVHRLRVFSDKFLSPDTFA